ncbi:MAG: arsinothricin resistance N-acetyltransferase ArsN1 family B [Hyphomicrobiaceae bacterium]
MPARSFEIRPATTSDAASIAAIYAPIVEHTAISFEEAPPAANEMAQRIAATLERFAYLVADEDGAVMGYAYAGAHRARPAYRWSVDVSVYVGDTARGKGVGKALYTDLLSRLEQAGYHAAFAGITLPNAASVALHESVGFIPVGVYREVGFKFDRWHDVGWWQCIL